MNRAPTMVFLAGDKSTGIFTPPPTRQILTIRDAVGAQFIAPMLVRETLRHRGTDARRNFYRLAVSLHNSIRRNALWLLRPTSCCYVAKLGAMNRAPTVVFLAGSESTGIFAPPAMRQFFTIRDPVGAQFIAPMLVREASDTARLRRGDRSTSAVSLHISFGAMPFGYCALRFC